MKLFPRSLAVCTLILRKLKKTKTSGNLHLENIHTSIKVSNSNILFGEEPVMKNSKENTRPEVS
ncbi:hypothetical protein NC651_012920 [Populus alba x Populus x berolinensis]|nr:hypothetical protein NC651_012920 [Populus alba x Populus x berolinensis]